MEPINYEDFRKLEAVHPYYANRWKYLSAAAEWVKELNPGSVLELGPNRLPLVKGSDTMDRINVLPGLTYHHDASMLPWPVKKKPYDLFIALQVWEHLGAAQKAAFQEVMRISRAAIMSFPYKWPAGHGCHSEIDDDVIASWTLHVIPRKVLQVGKRILYLFVFQGKEKRGTTRPR